MSKKKAAYYVVWRGKQPGIYDSWEICEAQVKGQQGAAFKGFATRAEAEQALSAGPENYIVRKPKTESQQPSAVSAVIDTPGIKGFGTIDFEREEVSHYFRDIFEAGRDCRFGNCTHTNEPGCAVKDKLITGEIALSRYESYLSMLEDTTEGKYRA